MERPRLRPGGAAADGVIDDVDTVSHGHVDGVGQVRRFAAGAQIAGTQPAGLGLEYRPPPAVDLALEGRLPPHGLGQLAVARQRVQARQTEDVQELA